MTRHYSPYDTTPTERFGDRPYEPSGHSGYTPDYKTDYATGQSTDHDADYDADYDYDGDGGDGGDVTFYEDPIDRRWIWVAAVAGAILLVAVICTVVILGGGDSGSVSATLTSPSAAPTQTTQPAQDATSKPVPPRAAPTAPLSPETVTTVTPAPSATAAPAPVAPPAEAAPPAANVSPNTITYRVTGNRQLIDLVTIVYTDEQGALQTDINVALPWAKTVVLNPGVQLKSVTATSVAGQLNCSIADASGAVIVAQANNTMITTCTQ